MNFTISTKTNLPGGGVTEDGQGNCGKSGNVVRPSVTDLPPHAIAVYRTSSDPMPVQPAVSPAVTSPILLSPVSASPTALREVGVGVSNAPVGVTGSPTSAATVGAGDSGAGFTSGFRGGIGSDCCTTL